MAPSPKPYGYVADPWTGELHPVNSEAEKRTALAGAYVKPTAGEVSAQQRKEKYDNAWAALALGLARGPSFGLADLALVRSGLMAAEDIRGYKEEKPLATIVGDVLGTVGSFAIPGAAGARVAGVAGKAGAGVGKGLALAQRGAGRGLLHVGGMARAQLPRLAGRTPGIYNPIMAPLLPAATRGIGPGMGLSRLAAGARGVKPTVLGELAEVGVREGITGAAIGLGQGISEVALDPEDLRAGEVADRLLAATGRGASVFAGLGVGFKGAGMVAGKVGRYFNRGVKNLEKAKATELAAEATVERVAAMGGDRAIVGAARADLAAAERTLGQIDDAIATGAGDVGTATARQVAAEQLQTARAQLGAAMRSPNPAAMQEAQAALTAARSTRQAAEATVANNVAGRAAGVALAYMAGGGIGLETLGLLAGPRILGKVGQIVKPMAGPLGGVAKDLQSGFTPQLVAGAGKIPYEKMIAAYAMGGPVAATGQLGLHLLGEKVAGTAVMAAADKLFPAMVHKGSLGLADFITGKAARARIASDRVLADVNGLTDSGVRSLQNIDIEELNATLAGSIAATVPPAVADKLTGRITAAMDYLNANNPANRYPPGITIPARELREFKQKAAVIAAPGKFMQDLARGVATPGQVEAFTATYPEAMGQLRQLLNSEVELLRASGKKLSRDGARALQSIGIQTPEARQFSPQFTATMQALHAGQVEETGPGPKPRPRPVTKAALAAQTPAQRLDAGPW